MRGSKISDCEPKESILEDDDADEVSEHDEGDGEGVGKERERAAE